MTESQAAETAQLFSGRALRSQDYPYDLSRSDLPGKAAHTGRVQSMPGCGTKAFVSRLAHPETIFEMNVEIYCCRMSLSRQTIL